MPRRRSRRAALQRRRPRSARSRRARRAPPRSRAATSRCRGRARPRSAPRRRARRTRDQPLGGPALALRGRGSLDLLQLLEPLAQPLLVRRHRSAEKLPTYHWCMLGGGSITLFHVRGIRIGVDWSWFLVLFLLIFWLSGFYGEVLGEEQLRPTPFRWRSPAPLGFFGSILLHELGHAFVAMRNGIGIASIQLWIFGGMARMDRDSDTPATEFKVALAGPAVTLAIVVVLTAIGIAAEGCDRLPRRGPGRERLRRLRRAGDARLAGLDQLPRPRLQPAAGLPDGRRPRGPRDRLVADRQPHLGDPLRRQPRPRASPTSSSPAASP